MFDLDDGDDNAAFYRSVEGSACLCRIAEVARGHARRAGDTTSRYGETRFGILLPGANTATARRIAEDLRRAIEDLLDRPSHTGRLAHRDGACGRGYPGPEPH